MNPVEAVLRTLHEGELALHDDLLAAAEEHAAEHEFHHVATDTARWSAEHARLIAATAADRGLHLPAAPDSPALTRLRRKAARDLAPRPDGLPDLLETLAALHLAAVRNSLHWEMLAQAAQAGRDGELLALASRCHPQTLRQMRWTNTLTKTLAPQLLTAS
ncbi:hypothetical protein [Kitasatospora phosalacinea]|uniref:Uncharacterized protein n=1 Tax=Kitasatospora phosalacinea TaxID=2065 RepID=A0A9W6PI81_9ACTN|nr:hypothetical protein [Kitasatospora phosalacinea]GLW55510.1 hypothetical protein Kpho01_35210 [Kitasatospora phosalacinea]